jgi:hypothetical protein
MQKYVAKNESVQALDNLIEMLGERALLQEWIIYASNDELQEFVQHCEDVFEVEAII